MNDDVLRLRASELFPKSEHNQSAWVRSVVYLRAHSNVGWAIDRIVGFKKESSVLKDYEAPKRPSMPEMRTHVSLPDDVIVPHANP